MGGISTLWQRMKIGHLWRLVRLVFADALRVLFLNRVQRRGACLLLSVLYLFFYYVRTPSFLDDDVNNIPILRKQKVGIVLCGSKTVNSEPRPGSSRNEPSY
jgi:hypothetical protein